jgi:hypothetical protein
MAVQSDTSRISYAGNNSTTTSYAVPFVFLENSHLQAIARTSAGVESTVTLTNHTGAGDVNGGTVRTAVAVPATSTLTIYRDVPATQTTIYQEGGDFPAASHERALDKLTQISQQNARQIGSTVRFSEATQLNPINPPVSATPHVLTTVNGGAPTWETVPSVSTALNIPALTDATTVNAADELIIQQGGITKRATAAELMNNAPVTVTSTTTARPLSERFEDAINIKDFGAVGDGVANDTAMFTLLESAVTGQSVNLGGLTCLVNAIPTGNNYYNGSLRVGNEIYSQSKNPKNHPWDAAGLSLRAVSPLEGVYAGLTVAMLPVQNDTSWMFIWRQAERHGVTNMSTIMAAKSFDGGHTLGVKDPFGLYTQQVVRQQDADLRAMAVGQMGGGRIGMVVRRQKEEDDAYLDPLFVYTDNPQADFPTWYTSTITLSPAGLEFNPIGHLQPYPASAGGHDQSGYILYFYTTGQTAISALTTVDNGATWTQINNVLSANSTVTSLNEVSVTRIGNQDRWVMACRQGAGNPVAFSTSTNMTTWTAAVHGPSYLKSNANAPTIMYDAGKLWVIQTSRSGREVFDEYANSLLISGGNAKDIFDSGAATGWGGWQVVTTVPRWALGYAYTPQKIRDRWYLLFSGSEDEDGSNSGRTAYLLLLSCDGTASANARDIYKMIPRPNMLRNSSFEYNTNPNGETGTTTSRAPTVDGYTLGRSASNTAEWSRVVDALIAPSNQEWTNRTFQHSRYLLEVGRPLGNSQTGTVSLISVLSEAESLPARHEWVTFSCEMRAMPDFSAANSQVTMNVHENLTGSESQVTGTSGVFSSDNDIGSGLNCKLAPYWQTFTYTAGRVSADNSSNQLLVRWSFAPAGVAGAADKIQIRRPKLEIGKFSTQFKHEPYHVTAAQMVQFGRTMTVWTINGTQWIPFGITMKRVPSVTASVGTVSNITADGFTLTHTSAASSVIRVAAWL